MVRTISSPATDASAALLAELVSLGVRDVVLSPGSRSQAPALIAADLERHGLIRLHVRIDERVAGFTALGLARESGLPVVVMCTSGTAVANLLPVALEAHHAGVPLVLLTADRPPELRGVGANQTTRQPGLFGPCARFAIDAPVPEEIDDTGEGEQSAVFRSIAADAFAASAGIGTRAPGPVHINLPLREPLAGTFPEWFCAWVDAAQAAADAGAERAGESVPTVTQVLEVVEASDAAAAHAPEAAEPEGGELESSGALYQGGGGIGAGDAADDVDASAFVLERGPRTIVVAGSDAGSEAERVAFEGGWPLIAEIVSGARYGRHVVHGYRELLADAELGGQVERAVVFGRPTLSREVVALLSRADLDVVAVRGPGERLNLNGVTESVEAVSVARGERDSEWLGAWLTASRARFLDLDPPAPDTEGLASDNPRERLAAVSAELGAIRRPLTREVLVDAVWRATWPHDRLVFGSSRLVRVADAILPGKAVPVHANRGVAGIDGTIATGIGVAIASQASGKPGITRVLLGDLAFLHDVGALLLPPEELEPRIQVIVGNDGGGTIFDGLEVAQVAGADDMTRVLYTPHTVRLEQIALAYGWEYHRPSTRGALDQLLTSPVGGRQLIEVPLSR